MHQNSLSFNTFKYPQCRSNEVLVLSVKDLSGRKMKLRLSKIQSSEFNVGFRNVSKPLRLHMPHNNLFWLRLPDAMYRRYPLI